MKIHSDVITYTQTIRNAARAVPGVDLDKLEQAGSRSRAHAFQVHLISDGTPDQYGAARRHRTNNGTGSNAYNYNPHAWAASYADWGHFLATLFELDPEMIAGPYNGAGDFHRQTRDAFRAPANV